MNNVPPILKTLMIVLGGALLVMYLQMYGPIQTQKTQKQRQNAQDRQAMQDLTTTPAPPLHEMVATDPAVAVAAQAVVDTPPRQFSRYTHAMQNLIFTWAGTANIPIDARGQWIDARKLEAIERIRGEKMRFAPDDRANPMKYQSRLVMQAWWMGIYHPVACPFFTHTTLNGMRLEDLYAVVDGRYSAPHQMPPHARRHLNMLVDTLRPAGDANSPEYRGYLSFILHCITYAHQLTAANGPVRRDYTPPDKLMAAIGIILHDAAVPHKAEKLLKIQFVVDEIDNKFDQETLISRLFYFLTIPYARIFVPCLFFALLAVYLTGLSKKRRQEKPANPGLKPL